MKKGFTLIELLAVIIILAVIALIATPIVLDVVDSAKKSAFESSAYGVIDAIKLESMENRLEGNTLTKEYTFPDTQLDVQGSQPEGTASVDSEGRMAIAVNDGKWCATKGYNDGTITIKEYVEGECTIPTSDGDVVVIEGDPIREKVAALVLDENGACNTTNQYMGGCYLVADTNTELQNYVWYNGFLWRIMGINNLGTENESIRMITEENVTAISYNVTDNTNFVDSHADSWLNEYFYEKLSDENNLKTNVIVEGTFCQGAVTTDYITNRTDCTGGTTLTRNVGLVSVDELTLSGGNTSYLKNGQWFWTMSPYDGSNAFGVNNYGNASDYGVTEGYGLRPVINVNPNSIITSGNGTLSDFYVLGEYKNETSTIETLSSAKIGEYVSLNGKTYRVVENGDTTKLIFDGYYQETSGTNYGMEYGDDNVFTPNDRITTESDTLSGVGYKLNTDVLNWLTSGENQDKLKSMIVIGNWYQNALEKGNSYTVSLDETSTPIEAQVGLIRVGEMLSGQSYSILTKNGTEVSGHSNADYYWTLTPSESIVAAWAVSNDGYVQGYWFDYANALRPVINVNSNLKITSGNGTLNNQFVIGIE